MDTLDLRQLDTKNKPPLEVDASIYQARSWEARSDEHLLDGLAHGFEEAMVPLYHRYNRLLFSLTLRMVGNSEVASELVQEGFVLIWRRADSYSPQKGPVKAWLVAIMHHHTIDYLRKQNRHTLFKEVAWEEGEWEEEGEMPDVWEEVWDNEQRQQVREALLRLPVEQRMVIMLAYFQGWTHAEITQRCGIPAGTVKSRIRLGLLRLKEILKTRQDENLC